MKRLTLPFLELLATNVCNLSCLGCTTYSDLDHRGYLSWAEAKSQLDPWLARLDITAIGFIGGEPLINPDLRNWLTGLREIMPHCQIRFVTNGILLDKHWWLIDALDHTGNAVLKISYHLSDPALDQTIERIFQSRAWKPIHEFGIDRWISPSGLRLQITKPTRFIKTFQGNYHNMSPHSSRPHEAFAICVQQQCPLLLNGVLYKCGTAGLVGSILARHGWPNLDQWRPYLGTGLAADCQQDDLERFVDNFGRPHAICSQCPSQRDTQSMIDHTKTVTFK